MHLTTSTAATHFKKAAIEHILDIIFELQADNALHKALSRKVYTIPEVFLMKKDEDLKALEYPNDKGILQQIPKGDAGLLKSFLQFIAHKSIQNNIFKGDDDWRAITCLDCKSFRVSHVNSVIPVVPIPVPNLTSTIQQPLAVNIVCDF